MCGIAGDWDFQARRSESDTLQRLRQMTDAILHRGPDGDGYWCDPARGIGLAHLRLAIVDLTPAGAQPMVSVSGRYTIVYNGEIYNHAALRQAVDAIRPMAWRGHSDTEALLAAIECWGLESALQRSVGMFAFALWDAQDECLYLVRDRAGEKPLYYVSSANGLAFASELPGLRASARLPGQVDVQALASLLRNGYIAGGLSIEAGAQQVPPGEWLRVARDGTHTRHRYWSAPAAPQASELSDAELLDHLEQLLEDAIGLQLMADVPVGAFLSGGVDSSLIAALGQKRSNGRLRTFTIGFDETAYDESPHAAAVARHLGTEHSAVQVSGRDALDLVPRLATLYGEPFADPSALPTALLMRAARRHVTVALSGDAGDELFAGYARYRQYPASFGSTRRLPGPLRRALPPLLGHGRSPMFDRLGRGLGRPQLGDRLHKALPLLGAEDFPQFAQAFASLWRDPAELLAAPFAPLAPGYGCMMDAATAIGRADAMSRHDFIDYLPQDILVKVDRAAMAISLETRTPLLDHRVIEFALQLPIERKLRVGRNGLQGKWPLRALLSRHVPDAIIDRPKQGFTAPIGPWLRGELKPWAEGLLFDGSTQRSGLFRDDVLREHWLQHQGGQRDWSRKLWPVLMFLQWQADRAAPSRVPRP
ncbi:asparagine synthase (glutamine-hydrolyzing) [Roseateles sp. NT4]|uniref:asparagine synthase (glutamine-hydrolyzing) n=1 Tax=Roseateles sp. NT4 TaxID=3453715 RepID=UPI003EE958AC